MQRLHKICSSDQIRDASLKMMVRVSAEQNSSFTQFELHQGWVHKVSWLFRSPQPLLVVLFIY